MEGHSGLCGANMDFVCDTRSRSGLPICRSQSETTYTQTADKVILVAGLAKGLPVGRDNCPAVFQRRRRVLFWCRALTNSSSANISNKLTEVGGVLLVVIHRYKYLFYKLGPTFSKFHPERSSLAVAVVWTNG